MVMTPPAPLCIGVRGGLRGPRRLRVPLRLRATDASFDGHRIAGLELGTEGRRQGRLERSLEAVFLEGGRPAGTVGAEVRATARHAAGGIERYHSIGQPYDAHQLALGALRAAGDTRAERHGSDGGRHGGDYDATASVDLLGPTGAFGLGWRPSSATAAPTAASVGWLDTSAACSPPASWRGWRA